ncbi:universal stress protein [Thalassotalea crassostreae]|uniref:universal stress protein n=1 Tax=Thalassotalea crassostreae TaxID=1763536 RepID=UPI0008395BF4|nr:universal stress protein [Thalassotalea crassostreae]
MNTILVINDSQEQDYTAIKQAADLAKAYKAKLHIVSFCYHNLRGVVDIEEAKARIVQDHHEIAANKLVNTLQGVADYDFETVWEKNVAPWVNKYVTDFKPTMVIKTGHRSEALFYTPTDWHLLRECPAPVYIAANKKWHKANTVLATIDIETLMPDKKQLNEKILEHASILAKQLNTELHVCYAVPITPILRKLGIHNKEKMESDYRADLGDVLKLIATSFGIDINNIHIKAGQVDKVITSVAADCKASIVVTGTVGRKGLEQKIIGNTAESILSLLKTDVLALKP